MTRRTAVALLLAVAASPDVASAGEPRIVRSWVVPRVPLTAGVALGGLSDLAPADHGAGGPPRLWALTDRGPNGSAPVGGRTVRTLLAPDFAPAVVRLRLDDEGAVVEDVVTLRTADGRPVTGRSPGPDRLVDAADLRDVPGDPDGVDPEAIVALADGTFWIGEEYRPGLLHVDADGRLLARFVPRGAAVAAVDRDVVPEIYAWRRENRGFEALAASADGRRLWALLQSPLDAGGRPAGGRSGNVRLLGFDTAAGVPAVEHVYRLGDPAAPGFLTDGAPPEDGKLCAMAALDDTTLLVLEQDDGGLARLYAADLAAATDTLDRAAGGDATLERAVDLPAAGIVPVRKTLVADLSQLRERMRAEVDDGASDGGPLKLEGLVVMDRRHVAFVNDDDFGVAQGRAGGPARSTRVWLVELPADLGGGVASMP